MAPLHCIRGLLASALAALALAACGGDAGAPAQDGTNAKASPAEPSSDTSDSDAAALPERRPRTRSLRLEQAGWRFDIDTQGDESGIRLEVLAQTATVGAAPRRLESRLEGELVDAFATDLDGDAVPELLLWHADGGSAAIGDIVGWRFAADGEATDLRLPTLDGDLATGWRGRDQFGVQGAHLVRSFPLYRDDDDNAHPTAGFVRVVRYALDTGGLFVADAMLEPMDGTPQAEVLAR